MGCRVRAELYGVPRAPQPSWGAACAPALMGVPCVRSELHGVVVAVQAAGSVEPKNKAGRPF